MEEYEDQRSCRSQKVAGEISSKAVNDIIAHQSSEGMLGKAAIKDKVVTDSIDEEDDFVDHT